MDSAHLPAPRSPHGLTATIEALLQDPRGRFCPQAVVLSDRLEQASSRVVMQVGEDDLGRVRIVTSEPLEDGREYRVAALPGSPPMPDAVYVLDSSREGQRPEDAVTKCWVHTLCVVRAPTPPSAGV